MFFSDKSLFRSVRLPKKVHGVVIKKLPVASYLAALNILAEPSAAILEAAFPGQDYDRILESCRTMTVDAYKALLLRVFLAAPKEIARVASELLGIPESRLFEAGPDALTIGQFADVLEAFWRMNDLSDFFETGRRLTSLLTARSMTESGSSG